MRWLERWFGVLAGAFGLIALALTLSQHAERIISGESVYGAAYQTADTLVSVLPMGLAAAALVASFAAVRDSSLASARGLWTWLVIGAALLCVVGVYLLAANNVWVVSVPPRVSALEINAAALFAPAALAAIVSMFTAFRPRATHA